MADSENSRTVPAIIHRNLLPVAEQVLLGLAADQEAAGGGDIDAALATWNDWIAAHREFARLCLVQQRLETQVLSLVSSPFVEIHLPSRTKPLIATTEEEIECWLEGDAFADERERAKRDFTERRDNWDAVDEFVGHSGAKAAETISFGHESRLVAALWAMPAHTLPAVAGKLHSIIMHGAPKLGTDDFPWPQVRSVLIDLLGMCQPSVTRAVGP